MTLRAWIKAVAFVLNGVVFLIGIARLQGRLAPPDYLYVGLLFGAPLVSSAALAMSYREGRDPEVIATVKAATVMLNVLILAFVVWLNAGLDPETRSDQALWLMMLLVAPPTNLLAVFLPPTQAPAATPAA